MVDLISFSRIQNTGLFKSNLDNLTRDYTVCTEKIMVDLFSFHNNKSEKSFYVCTYVVNI